MRIMPSRLFARFLVLAAGALALSAPVQGGEKPGKEVTLAADKAVWEELAAKGAGVMVCDVHGHHAKGAWKGFVKFPAGSKSGLHAHSSDLGIVVVSGTFRYGPDPDHEQIYGPGSYIFIPAKHPHANSQPDGALLYIDQPGKYDNTPLSH